MIISQPAESSGICRIATVLSLITAVFYFIIAFGFVPDGFESPPVPVMFVAGLSYLVGGLLILRAGRRLLQIGAVLNLLVLLAFAISAVMGNATIDALSIFSKVAQIGLEIALLWLLSQELTESDVRGTNVE